MQMLTSILLIAAIQLFLLISAVYMAVYLHLRHRIRFHALSVLLPVLSSINLILLLQRLFGQAGFIPFAEGNDFLFFTVICALMLVFLYCLVLEAHIVMSRQRNTLSPHSIRETVDHLPGGICFSTPNGKPILTNRRMNELVFQLTGHTIINAKVTWDELRQLSNSPDCVKPDIRRMHKGNDAEITDDTEYFILPDESIWRFRTKDLVERTPHYLQLEAADISDLYHYSQRLYEDNQRLAEQHRRLQDLLANIVEINQEKEILTTKMRIHDDLGRSILTTKQHLHNLTLSENINQLAEVWSDTIRKIEDFTQSSAVTDISPESELQKAADLIGCHIDFIGERPNHRKNALLFYAAVREALSNAVTHSKADRLIVSISSDEKGYHIEMTDNGNAKPVFSIKEGNGLSNLRRKLEQEGATLQIKNDNGVTLIVDLPNE